MGQERKLYLHIYMTTILKNVEVFYYLKIKNLDLYYTVWSNLHKRAFLIYGKNVIYRPFYFVKTLTWVNEIKTFH